MTHLASRITVYAVFAGLMGCTASPDHHYFHKQEEPHAADWGYQGGIGPEHWGDLSPDYALAKTGREQSPIDLRGAVEQDLPAITFDYQPSRIELVYNGHTVEEMEEVGSSIQVEGKQFDLAQFHFHSPSEHTVDGRHTPMEMHLVHKSSDGEIAVVSVLLAEGAENTAFAPVWDYLPTPANRTRKAAVTVDTAALLPVERSYYRYTGSLTTPPCTQGVRWLVLQTPVELSKAQIEKFRTVIKGNNRPVQALNARTVSLSK